MTSPAMRRQMVVDATLKRNAAMNISTGVKGAAYVVTTFKTTHADPIDDKIAERFGLEAPVQYLVAYTHGDYDIRHGDILVLSGREYPIKGLGVYPDRIGVESTYEMILENMHNA